MNSLLENFIFRNFFVEQNGKAYNTNDLYSSKGVLEINKVSSDVYRWDIIVKLKKVKILKNLLIIGLMNIRLYE